MGSPLCLYFCQGVYLVDVLLLLPDGCASSLAVPSVRHRRYPSLSPMRGIQILATVATESLAVRAID